MARPVFDSTLRKVSLVESACAEAVNPVAAAARPPETINDPAAAANFSVRNWAAWRGRPALPKPAA